MNKDIKFLDKSLFVLNIFEMYADKPTGVLGEKYSQKKDIVGKGLLPT